VLDGGLAQVFNGTYFSLYPNSSLYLASNLTEGAHRVSLTNIGNGPIGTAFDIDYAIVNSTFPPGSGNSTGTSTSNTTLPSSSSSSGSGGSHTNAGAIAGGVVGGIVALAVVAAAIWWFFFRKKRDGRGRYKEPIDLTGEEVQPYSDTPTGRTTESPPQTSTTPFLTSLPPPPPSSATSYPMSAAGDTTLPSQTTDDTPSNPATRASHPTSASAIAPSSSGRTKSWGAYLPFTAHPPAPTSATATTTTTVPPRRMTVPGREIDMGPVTGTDDLELLPPDYNQATEPLPGQRP